MNTCIKIGVRPSSLAFKQAKEVTSRFKEFNFNIIPIWTKGDRDKKTPLVLKEGEDFFTREIEEALLEGKIDVAIHSAKDLEDNPPQELQIALLTNSVSPFDCLVSRNNETLDQLSFGSIVGTSSRNRRDAIKHYRSDLTTLDIRGNIEERILQLDQGKFDAIIVAHAALIRLGLENRISQIIPFSIIRPHPLQGRLAIQVAGKRRDLKKLFKERYEQ